MDEVDVNDAVPPLALIVTGPDALLIVPEPTPVDDTVTPVEPTNEADPVTEMMSTLPLCDAIETPVAPLRLI